MNPRHTLVVGGSGMLAKMCEQLATEEPGNHVVSVLARGTGRLNRIAAQAAAGGGRIVPLSLDYTDTLTLENALHGMCSEHDKPSRVVCWIHENLAPNALLTVARYARGVFWHVLGGSAADPSQVDKLNEWNQKFSRTFPGLDYRQIILGFKIMPDGQSRWLSNDEISDGVFSTLKTHERATTVGTTHPWSQRPQDASDKN